MRRILDRLYWAIARFRGARIRRQYRDWRRSRVTPVREIGVNRDARRFIAFRRAGRRRIRIRIRGPALVGEESDEPEDLKHEHKPISILAEMSGEASGEMAVNDIPLGIPDAEYQELISNNDEKPRELVVMVRPGKSKRGWNYTRKVFERVAGEVMSGGLPGYKGHQDPKTLDYEFRDPKTHWIGAKEQNGTFYFRGVMDRAAGELKGLIRAGRTKQVSIFGYPKLGMVAGEIHVIDYEPISLDWTPLKRAGMDTAIVAYGEMEVLPETKPENKPENKGGKVETLAEWLAKGRELNVTPGQAIGEMSHWKAEDVAKAASLEIVTDEQKKTLEAVGEMATKLGIEADSSGKLDLAKLGTEVDRLAKLGENERTAERDKTIKKVVGEMVASDKVQPIVAGHSKISALGDAPTEDQIKVAVGEVLALPEIQAAAKGLGMTINVDPQNGGGAGGSESKTASSFSKTKTASI